MRTAVHTHAPAFRLAFAFGFAALLGSSAEAVPIVTVSGEGLAAANAAQTAFLSGLATSVTESFEGYTVGYYDPLVTTTVGTFSQVSPGDNEQYCTPHCSDGLWVLDATHSPPWGRFATDGSKWLDTNDSRVTKWDASPLPELPTQVGFFITDPDDAGGNFQILALNGLGDSVLADLLPHSQSNGTVFYVTISDPAGLSEFKILSNDHNDGLGIDEFTAGNPVPEPGTLGLLGSGLLAAALRARRRRR
jgi:hypothetical protein